MKKVLVFVAISIIAIVFIISCKKDNENVDSNITNQTKSNSTGKKTCGLKTTGFEGIYSLASHVGHNSSDCKNSCVMINGIKTHYNCQFWGNKCSLYIVINTRKDQPDLPEDPYYSALAVNSDEPTNDSIFFMPNRSFYIEDQNLENGYIWMNIPEQLLERDSTNKFNFYKITFTSEALFENL